MADLCPPPPFPQILCAHDKVPPSPLSHLLEMSLHVRMQQASRDGMKMGINANENWALAFCLMSQWLFPSFPRLGPQPHTSLALSLTCPDKPIPFSSPPYHQSSIPRSLWKHIVLSTRVQYVPLLFFFRQSRISLFLLSVLSICPPAVCLRVCETDLPSACL